MCRDAVVELKAVSPFNLQHRPRRLVGFQAVHWALGQPRAAHLLGCQGWVCVPQCQAPVQCVPPPFGAKVSDRRAAIRCAVAGVSGQTHGFPGVQGKTNHNESSRRNVRCSPCWPAAIQLSSPNNPQVGTTELRGASALALATATSLPWPAEMHCCKPAAPQTRSLPLLPPLSARCVHWSQQQQQE